MATKFRHYENEVIERLEEKARKHDAAWATYKVVLGLVTALALVVSLLLSLFTLAAIILVMSAGVLMTAHLVWRLPWCNQWEAQYKLECRALAKLPPIKGRGGPEETEPSLTGRIQASTFRRDFVAETNLVEMVRMTIRRFKSKE